MRTFVQAIPRRAATAAATSYINLGGTGDRRDVIGIQASSSLLAPNTMRRLIDSTPNNTCYFGAVTVSSDHWMLFDFGIAVVIDEAKWYQDNLVTHGTWKWQGSNDNSSFTDIGTSFTLGGATVQTHTQLNGNNVAYRYYRLTGVSGSTNTSNWNQGFDFKIANMVDPRGSGSYSNTGGSGDRRSIITMSDSGIIAGGSPRNGFIDGSTTENYNYWNTSQNPLTGDDYVRWDFGTGKVITQARYYQDTNNDYSGFWKWQGSNDGVSWVDIGHQFLLGGDSFTVITALGNNATSFRYYQIVGVSGNVSGLPWVREFEFCLV